MLAGGMAVVARVQAWSLLSIIRCYCRTLLCVPSRGQLWSERDSSFCIHFILLKILPQAVNASKTQEELRYSSKAENAVVRWLCLHFGKPKKVGWVVRNTVCNLK